MKPSDDRFSRIEISTGTLVRAVVVVLAFWLLWYLRDIILIVLTSIILASAVEPAVRFFVRREIPIIKRTMPRTLALVLTYGLGALSLLGIMYFFVPAVASDMSQVVRMLPSAIDAATTGSGHAAASSSPVAELLAPQTLELRQGLIESANVLDLFSIGIESKGALHTAGIFFGGLLSFVMIIVLSFYLSAQERGIENFLRLISPMSSRGYVVDLWKRSQQKIGLWAQGQLMLGVVVGVLVFLIMTMLGIPSALFLAIVAMFFELIPVFGPILAAVPAVILAFLNGINPLASALAVDPGLNAALIVVGIYFLIQQIESSVIYPEVVRKIVGIPPVLVILSLVIGAKIAGFLGVVLAVPITAIVMEVLNDIARERRIYDAEHDGAA